ncbi:MAG: glycosyltransferase, partial [Pyrinomonadaceae bacterium]
MFSGSKKTGLRILFVSRIENVHTSRWIAQLRGQGWDIHLFPATPGVPRPDFKDVTIYNISSSRPPGLSRSTRLRGVWPLRIGTNMLSLSEYRFLPSWASRSAWLARLVRWIEPDVVHSLEIQHSGYTVLQAKSKFRGDFPPWIVTNWGSDIYLFGRLSE